MVENLQILKHENYALMLNMIILDEWWVDDNVIRIQKSFKKNKAEMYEKKASVVIEKNI